MKRLIIKDKKLWLDDKEFYLASGDFHYFRTLRSGWQRRLKLMKAFGLTAVQTYVAWNLHEPEKGEFCFEGHLDLKAFLEMCQEEGLYVLLRPSPYICSECDFGGLPYWLMKDRETCIRTSDETYISHVREYMKRLCEEFVPMLSTNGGPILAVALENEYGSFGMDLNYLQLLKQMYEEYGVDVPFYTAGGPDLFKQTFGGFPDLWSGLDLRDNVPKAIKEWNKFQQDFPAFITEMWGGCALQWGGVFPRQKPGTVAKNYKEALQTGAFVNFYMFCGGTNFGFFNGALHAVYRADVAGARDRYIPFTTSYDVDALIDEAGNATEKYMYCRKVLADYRGISVSELPPLPENVPVQIPDGIRWTASCRMFEELDYLTEKKVTSGNFQTMESLDQDYGWILYTTYLKATDATAAFRLHIDGIHDRADIYVNGIWKGTYYRDRDNTPIEFAGTGKSDRIDILVENMGRIGYGAHMILDSKGIQNFAWLDVCYPDGTMMYNKGIITNWENRTLPMRAQKITGLFRDKVQLGSVGMLEPHFFHGEFQAEPGVDTFLNFCGKNLKKGCIWINGFNLGRYWTIGPQDTLYIPGELLRENNVIDVFELYSDGNIPKLRFQDHHELDSISQNAELVLAARA